jgi:hypothetical protein
MQGGSDDARDLTARCAIAKVDREGEVATSSRQSCSNRSAPRDGISTPTHPHPSVSGGKAAINSAHSATALELFPSQGATTRSTNPCREGRMRASQGISTARAGRRNSRGRALTAVVLAVAAAALGAVAPVASAQPAGSATITTTFELTSAPGTGGNPVTGEAAGTFSSSGAINDNGTVELQLTSGLSRRPRLGFCRACGRSQVSTERSRSAARRSEGISPIPLTFRIRARAPS